MRLNSSTKVVQSSFTRSRDAFLSRELSLPPQSVHKAVVYLRRSDATNGCTVVLRGDEGAALGRLKRVIRRTALVAANCVYEKAFLVKEYAAPVGDCEYINLDDVSLSPFIALPDVRCDLIGQMLLLPAAEPAAGLGAAFQGHR